MLRHDTLSTQHNRFLASLYFAMIAIPAVAESPITWRIAAGEGDCSLVQLKTPMSRLIDSERPFFIVTHGMNGTTEGDRFHGLAGAIAGTSTEANVLILDWSEASCAETPWLGLPDPFTISQRIDAVGDEAAAMLDELGFRPNRATLIGESFGNWVNARIANRLGMVNRILAMNPASEFAGYPPPNLRRCALTSWAFHTYSVFDTLKRVADVSIYLETPASADCFVQHTHGIGRVTAMLLAGDDGWLHDQWVWDRGDNDRFDAMATLDGNLIRTDLLMIRPPADEAGSEKGYVQPMGVPGLAPVHSEGTAPSGQTLASATIR